MKISVVTISYNQLDFLKACIDSVAQQDGPYEHIIVDPGSTDGSREYIESRRSHFSHIVFEKDKGAADGLNRGFQRANGDIYYYLNSDDVIQPGSFGDAREAFDASPNVDVIYGDGDMIDERGELIRSMKSMPIFSPYLYLIGGGSIVQQSTFIKAAAFKKAGGFNIENKACWDGELLADLGMTGARFNYVRKNWGGFRIHGQSISGGGDPKIQQRWKETRLAMFQKAIGRKPNKGDKAFGFFVRNAFRGIKLFSVK